jgi:hypothetical protein
VQKQRPDAQCSVGPFALEPRDVVVAEPNQTAETQVSAAAVDQVAAPMALPPPAQEPARQARRVVEVPKALAQLVPAPQRQAPMWGRLQPELASAAQQAL